jgi:hypothetical protein
MSFREAMVECASDVACPRYLPCGVGTEGEMADGVMRSRRVEAVSRRLALAPMHRETR